jgi:hypothetical protein
VTNSGTLPNHQSTADGLINPTSEYTSNTGDAIKSGNARDLRTIISKIYAGVVGNNQ